MMLLILLLLQMLSVSQLEQTSLLRWDLYRRCVFCDEGRKFKCREMHTALFVALLEIFLLVFFNYKCLLVGSLYMDCTAIGNIFFPLIEMLRKRKKKKNSCQVNKVMLVVSEAFYHKPPGYFMVLQNCKSEERLSVTWSRSCQCVSAQLM